MCKHGWITAKRALKNSREAMYCGRKVEKRRWERAPREGTGIL